MVGWRPTGSGEGGVIGGRWVLAAAGFIWGAGTLACLIRWGRQVIRLRRLLANSWPVADARLRVNGVLVRISGEVSGPCVAGFWRPVLLVPPEAESWPAVHWRMMIEHETQHIRQGDLKVGWLPRLVVAAYWWHPLAHWMARQFHLESEALCDRAVVSARRDVRAYVEFLLLLDGARLPRLVIPMARVPGLRARVERLLEPPGRKVGILSVTTALVLLAGVVVLALSLRTRPEPAGASDRWSDTMTRLSASPFPADAQ